MDIAELQPSRYFSVDDKRNPPRQITVGTMYYLETNLAKLSSISGCRNTYLQHPTGGGRNLSQLSIPELVSPYVSLSLVVLGSIPPMS